MPCTTCGTYYDTSTTAPTTDNVWRAPATHTLAVCDAPIRWHPGAVPAPARPRRPREPGVWCETCNCVVRVLICECVREALRNNRTRAEHERRSWWEIIGNRAVCSLGGHDIRVPTQQETTALNVKKLKALQKWRRDLKNELVPELLRAHDANRAEIAKKILLYVGFDHPWKIY